jgi:hypothetical protein
MSGDFLHNPAVSVGLPLSIRMHLRTIAGRHKIIIQED